MRKLRDVASMSHLPKHRETDTGFDPFRRARSAGGLFLPQDLLWRLLEEEAATRLAEQADAANPVPGAAECGSVPHAGFPMPAPVDDLPSLQVFDLDRIEQARTRVNQGDKETAKLILSILNEATRDAGRRFVLSGKSLLPRFRRELWDLARDMPNFATAIDHLASELALAVSGDCADFRVTPILLHGAPGIGKTRFGSQLGKILGVGFEKIALGAASGNFELAGTSQGWGTTRPGRLATILARGSDASPVLLLDEVDKLGGDQRFPVLPVLLDLLEPDSAKTFRDECLEMEMDASRILVIATANEAEAIPTPLQSRLTMIEVKSPTVEQRLEIARRLASSYEARFDLIFDAAILEALASADIDLRYLQQALRYLAGRALLEEREVSASDLHLPAAKKHTIGYV